MSNAQAYVYNGMWVADCPTGCRNTERLSSPGFTCTYCGYTCTDIIWPDDSGAIMRILALRPFPHNRNWYPAGHPVAAAAHIPAGQTIDDLITENAEHGIGCQD
jgi:hypothetical protein